MPNLISLLSIHIASLVKIPCYLLKLSSVNENMDVSRADNSVKIWWNLPISNPKPDLFNVNAYNKFDENPLLYVFTQVIIRKRDMGMSQADNSVKNWWNLPISNPKPDLHNINAKFGENPLMFTQVIIWKRKTDGWTDVRQTDGLTDNQGETIIPRHNCVAGYKNVKSLEVWNILTDRIS